MVTASYTEVAAVFSLLSVDTLLASLHSDVVITEVSQVFDIVSFVFPSPNATSCLISNFMPQTPRDLT